jgi:hypothetical protein
LSCRALPREARNKLFRRGLCVAWRRLDQRTISYLFFPTLEQKLVPFDLRGVSQFAQDAASLFAVFTAIGSLIASCATSLRQADGLVGYKPEAAGTRICPPLEMLRADGSPSAAIRRV